MGLMLSVLVFSVGVIEALSCFNHFQRGYVPFNIGERGWKGEYLLPTHPHSLRPPSPIYRLEEGEGALTEFDEPSTSVSSASSIVWLDKKSPLNEKESDDWSDSHSNSSLELPLNRGSSGVTTAEEPDSGSHRDEFLADGYYELQNDEGSKREGDREGLQWEPLHSASLHPEFEFRPIKSELSESHKELATNERQNFTESTSSNLSNDKNEEHIHDPSVKIHTTFDSKLYSTSFQGLEHRSSRSENNEQVVPLETEMGLHGAFKKINYSNIQEDVSLEQSDISNGLREATATVVCTVCDDDSVDKIPITNVPDISDEPPDVLHGDSNIDKSVSDNYILPDVVAGTSNLDPTSTRIIPFANTPNDFKPQEVSVPTVNADSDFEILKSKNIESVCNPIETIPIKDAYIKEIELTSQSSLINDHAKNNVVQSIEVMNFEDKSYLEKVEGTFSENSTYPETNDGEAIENDSIHKTKYFHKREGSHDKEIVESRILDSPEHFESDCKLETSIRKEEGEKNISMNLETNFQLKECFTALPVSEVHVNTVDKISEQNVLNSQVEEKYLSPSESERPIKMINIEPDLQILNEKPVLNVAEKIKHPALLEEHQDKIGHVAVILSNQESLITSNKFDDVVNKTSVKSDEKNTNSKSISMASELQSKHSSQLQEASNCVSSAQEKVQTSVDIRNEQNKESFSKILKDDEKEKTASASNVAVAKKNEVSLTSLIEAGEDRLQVNNPTLSNDSKIDYKTENEHPRTELMSLEEVLSTKKELIGASQEKHFKDNCDVKNSVPETKSEAGISTSIDSCINTHSNPSNAEPETSSVENVGLNIEKINKTEKKSVIATTPKPKTFEDSESESEECVVNNTLVMSSSIDEGEETFETIRVVPAHVPSDPSPEKAFWLIFSGEYTKAMSKEWHSGHFCCWQCDESLTGQRYVLREEHPYCIKCYESVFANSCEECSRIIGIDSKDLSYKDKHWHESCFLCSKCRVSLVDKQFGSKADKIYCGNCYDAQFASRCDGCGQIFRAGTKKMEYKTRQWHEQCFCCCVCKTPIGTKSFIPREQEIYCATCYEEKFATRCIKCNKIITSGGVTYKNEPWHRECFTCTNCNSSLAGQRFTSRDDKPYCADCFGELFAKRCTACCKPITGIGGTRFISFEDRHWHNDCFICASCKTSLVGRGFITDAEDIICPECAKQKLI